MNKHIPKVNEARSKTIFGSVGMMMNTEFKGDTERFTAVLQEKYGYSREELEQAIWHASCNRQKLF
jgi:uncharacterized protein YjbJ (UPF0337 family)